MDGGEEGFMDSIYFSGTLHVNVQKQECRHNHTCLDSVGASPVLFHFR